MKKSMTMTCAIRHTLFVLRSYIACIIGYFDCKYDFSFLTQSWYLHMRIALVHINIGALTSLM